MYISTSHFSIYLLLFSLGKGLGGSVGRGKQAKDGAMVVLDSQSLRIIHESKPSRQWISDVKYSPDGSILAIGSHDNSIYFFDVRNNFKPAGKFSKHNSYITHFDFSRDGRAIQR